MILAMTVAPPVAARPWRPFESVLSGTGCVNLRGERRGDVASLAEVSDYTYGGLHMATNLSIDPDLLDRALAVSGERTKKAAVTRRSRSSSRDGDRSACSS
jgi:hypothetical protein